MTVLRIRDVRLIVGAVGLSAFGDFLLWVPLALHIEAMTGSPLALSGFFLALFGPSVALGGVAGRLADRVENARLLWTVSLLQAVVVAAMALATGSLAAILVLTVALGIGVAISQPAEFALVPAA
jgi:predicted MFS family arabinose efflux permease